MPSAQRDRAQVLDRGAGPGPADGVRTRVDPGVGHRIDPDGTLANVAKARLRLDADDPRPSLPVVSALHAADDALGGVADEVHARRSAPVLIGPGVADVTADVEAGPIV